MTISLTKNSVLAIESSNNGWKIQEHLKGFHPTAIAIDSQNHSRHIAEHGKMDLGKLMIKQPCNYNNS